MVNIYAQLISSTAIRNFWQPQQSCCSVCCKPHRYQQTQSSPITQRLKNPKSECKSKPPGAPLNRSACRKTTPHLISRSTVMASSRPTKLPGYPFFNNTAGATPAAFENHTKEQPQYFDTNHMCLMLHCMVSTSSPETLQAAPAPHSAAPSPPRTHQLRTSHGTCLTTAAPAAST